MDIIINDVVLRNYLLPLKKTGSLILLFAKNDIEKGACLLILLYYYSKCRMNLLCIDMALSTFLGGV